MNDNRWLYNNPPFSQSFEIDNNNPLTKGLVFNAEPVLRHSIPPIDLITDNIASINSNASMVAHHIYGSALDATADNAGVLTYDVTDITDYTNGLTVAVQYTNTALPHSFWGRLVIKHDSAPADGDDGNWAIVITRNAGIYADNEIQIRGNLDTSGSYYIASTAIATIGEPILITFTIQPSTSTRVSVYRNGLLTWSDTTDSDAKAMQGAITNNGTRFNIGGPSSTATTRYVRGYIGGVRVWNRVLNQNEIYDLNKNWWSLYKTTDVLDPLGIASAIITAILNSASSSALGYDLTFTPGAITQTVNKSDAASIGYDLSNLYVMAINTTDSAAIGNDLTTSVGNVNKTINKSDAPSIGYDLDFTAGAISQTVNKSDSVSVGYDLTTSVGAINQAVNKSDATGVGYDITTLQIQTINLSDAVATGYNLTFSPGTIIQTVNTTDGAAIGYTLDASTGLLQAVNKSDSIAVGNDLTFSAGAISQSVNKSDSTAIGYSLDTVSGTVVSVNLSDATAVGNALDFIAGAINASVNKSDATSIGYNPNTNYIQAINLADSILAGYDVVANLVGQSITVGTGSANAIGYNSNIEIGAIAILVNKSNAVAIGYEVTEGVFVLVVDPDRIYTPKNQDRTYDVSGSRVYILKGENRTHG